MGTITLDISTVIHAMASFEDAVGGGSWQWHAPNHNRSQHKLLDWWAIYRNRVMELEDMHSEISDDYEVLNKFLQSYKFPACFNPFDGIGVASILDMLVKWSEKGRRTTLHAMGTTYPAFTLKPSSVVVYKLVDARNPLVGLKTETGHTMWLFTPDEAPTDGIDLMMTVEQILATTKRQSQPAQVTVPMLDIDTSSDVSWLKGLVGYSEAHDTYVVEDAFQMVKIRVNEIGARVKAATGVTLRGISVGPEPIVFDRPFIAWFTQPGHEKFPLAATYADTDSWKKPAGSLEDL
jgi:hypothetical protein